MLPAAPSAVIAQNTNGENGEGAGPLFVGYEEKLINASDSTPTCIARREFHNGQLAIVESLYE